MSHLARRYFARRRRTAPRLPWRCAAFCMLTGLVALQLPGSQAAAAQQADDPAAASGGRSSEDTAGAIAVTDPTTVEACNRCHAVDENGMMSRVSFMRKTPEGWQQSIRRMVMLNDVELDPATAREIVRYLSDSHGIAPEELASGRFEVERRMVDYEYEADREVEYTCIRCHSMGRVVTQRRSREEWSLLMATHRGYYPLSDTQGFRRIGPPAPDESDTRHPMEKAVAHFAGVFPLETPEWTSWSATKRPPRLAGTWGLRGHEPGAGPVYGRVTIEEGADGSSFSTTVEYANARTGTAVHRTGRSVIYTGYQWRGRSFEGADEATALREVMIVNRDWDEIDGRWFAGAYDEFGLDVTLVRADGPVLLGLYPVALQAGTEAARVRIFGIGMDSGEVEPDDVDLGPGVRVTRVVSADPGALTVEVLTDSDAAVGKRDVYVGGRAVPGSLMVYRSVDRIVVTPEAGMARLGGGAFPKGFAQFEASGFSNGPDGKPDTDDDLPLGQVDVTWTMEEYAAVFDDDDIAYVGELDQNGRFHPAIDGPNPSRSGSRNNVGDVWVVAAHQRSDGDAVRGRAHLIVTVPLYMRWEPWRVTEGAPGSQRVIGSPPR